jgi:hypothetical protein
MHKTLSLLSLPLLLVSCSSPPTPPSSVAEKPVVVGSPALTSNFLSNLKAALPSCRTPQATEGFIAVPLSVAPSLDNSGEAQEPEQRLAAILELSKSQDWKGEFCLNKKGSPVWMSAPVPRGNGNPEPDPLVVMHEVLVKAKLASVATLRDRGGNPVGWK